MKTREKSRKSSVLAIGALSALLTSTFAVSADLDEPEGITDRATLSCPLNSGGPSLLGTSWRVSETYGTAVPEGLDMTMTVSLDTMAGETGCNKYAAKFKQVGNTGFSVAQIARTRHPCALKRTEAGKPTIHVGNHEGAYLRIIKRMGSVQQMDDGTLVFYDRNGKKGLVMTKI